MPNTGRLKQRNALAAALTEAAARRGGIISEQHTKEVVRQDNARVEIVEKAIHNLVEDVNNLKGILVESLDVITHQNLKVVHLERELAEFRSHVAHEFKTAGDELIKGAL